SYFTSWPGCYFLTSLSITAAAARDTYTLSLHDALPIWADRYDAELDQDLQEYFTWTEMDAFQLGYLTCSLLVHKYNLGSNPALEDRKSTRLNSSHVKSSYAVFCLKKKLFR